MTIRLRFEDGTIVEADSIAELLEYQRAYHRGVGKASTPSEGGSQPLPAKAQLLVKKLLPERDGIDTAKLAQILGVEPRGVGGYVTSLTSWGRKHGYTKKQLIQKSRRPEGGKQIRRVSLADSFRKEIDKGAVKV